MTRREQHDTEYAARLRQMVRDASLPTFSPCVFLPSLPTPVDPGCMPARRVDKIKKKKGWIPAKVCSLPALSRSIRAPLLTSRRTTSPGSLRQAKSKVTRREEHDREQAARSRRRRRDASLPTLTACVC